MSVSVPPLSLPGAPFPRRRAWREEDARARVLIHRIIMALGSSRAAEVPSNRYTHLVSEEEASAWHETFMAFDRDGGGDVDLFELGAMFRNLGYSPPESEMKEVCAKGHLPRGAQSCTRPHSRALELWNEASRTMPTPAQPPLPPSP